MKILKIILLVFMISPIASYALEDSECMPVSAKLLAESGGKPNICFAKLSCQISSKLIVDVNIACLPKYCGDMNKCARHSVAIDKLKYKNISNTINGASGSSNEGGTAQ